MELRFSDLPLCTEIQQVIQRLGFVNPTEIQGKAIPLLVEAETIDFHGQAQTGTGKTLAFGLPLLSKIDAKARFPQALVIAPTRELAVQITESLAAFAKVMGIQLEAVYGGVSIEEQTRALARGAQVVVGTPGRLNDHLRRRSLNLKDIKTLVLDEADIMLDMGFKEEVDELLSAMPSERNIWLFSATVKPGIDQIKRAHMKDPVVVRVSSKQTMTSNTKQYYCVMPSRGRCDALSRFIECAADFYGFIFCQTKVLTSEIAEQLLTRGYRVGALHGDMSQQQRNIMMRKFKNKEITIMVATDVAARGIDVQDLTHVINFSVPEDLESYVHRIGRTGRAGKEGTAITFVGRNDVYQIRHIEQKFNVRLERIEVPTRDEMIRYRVQQASDYIKNLIETKTQPHDEVAQLVSSLDADQCRTIAGVLLHDRFVKSILEQEEIQPARFEAAPARAPRYASRVQDGFAKEISLGVGSDDGVTKSDIFDVITKTGQFSKDHILKLRIIKRRTFLEVACDQADQLVQALRNAALAGRKLRPTIVEPSAGR